MSEALRNYVVHSLFIVKQFLLKRFKNLENTLS